jgi:hypothetical protein
MAQAPEHMPSKRETLSSNPSIAKNKTKTKIKQQQKAQRGYVFLATLTQNST